LQPVLLALRNRDAGERLFRIPAQSVGKENELETRSTQSVGKGKRVENSFYAERGKGKRVGNSFYAECGKGKRVENSFYAERGNEIREKSGESMYLSDISIRRPVLATVMSLAVLLVGLVAYDRLSIREYPDIDEPVISITRRESGNH